MSKAINPATMNLPHLFADDNGDTYFGTVDFDLPLQNFAPPAAPFHTSPGQPASQFVIIRLPAGWIGEAHVSPKPQIMFCLTGRLKVTCSAGETMVLEKGMGFVMSDVSGKATKARSRPTSR